MPRQGDIPTENYGHGIIGKAQVTALREKEKSCQDLLNQQRYSSSVCFALLDEIVAQSYGSSSGFKVSQYDVRKVESQSKGKMAGLMAGMNLPEGLV